MRRDLKRIDHRHRLYVLEQEAFNRNASWLLFCGNGGQWLAAGKFKVHLADPDGMFTNRPWCNNKPPQVNGKDAPHGMVAPTHVSQICVPCRKIAIERKIVWRNLLYVKES